MFDRVYDFFFGDQRRKHIVLVSAFFLGQFFAIPLLGWLEPSQYVALAVAISFISVWPLTLFYDKLHTRRRATGEPERVYIQAANQALIGNAIGEIDRMLFQMASLRPSEFSTDQTARDIILQFVETNTLSRNFLLDYDQLRKASRQGVFSFWRGFSDAAFSSSLRNVTELMNRLYSVSYANEKTIHESLSIFERIMIRNFEVLKEAKVSQEAMGRMIGQMHFQLRIMEEFYSKEVMRIIEENKRNSRANNYR
jgi:hypothetical protein